MSQTASCWLLHARMTISGIIWHPQKTNGAVPLGHDRATPPTKHATTRQEAEALLCGPSSPPSLLFGWWMGTFVPVCWWSNSCFIVHHRPTTAHDTRSQERRKMSLNDSPLSRVRRECIDYSCIIHTSRRNSRTKSTTDSLPVRRCIRLPGLRPLHDEPDPRQDCHGIRAFIRGGM